LSNNRYYSINQNYSSNGGYCNKSHIDSGLCGGSSSYDSPSGYERVSYHDSSNNYTGHGGASCSVADIQKATSVTNAIFDDSNPGNQINALFAVLFDNVRFECSANNIKMCEQINNLNNNSSKNKVQLKKMAGILKQKESKGELRSADEKLILDWLTRQYGYPSYPPPPGYVLQKQDDTGIYYNYSPGTGIGNIIFQFIHNGYIKLDETHIKLDWSNELKKYNELLAPKPQYIYRVGSLTFFSEQSAKEFVEATRHVRPCDINRN
jgi:hypothetical protein